MLQRRQDELERKAQELERREQELRNNTSQARPNNWPPLPAACCGLQPCFYHDIQLDIPTEFQKIVTNLYRLWICEFILYNRKKVQNLVDFFLFHSLCTFIDSQYIGRIDCII